jgi:membrane protein DedA with SNARE-associated domain
MEFISLSDVLIKLIPIYGQGIIFGVVALESAGVPLPGETILVAAALLTSTTGQINIVVVMLAAAAGAIVGVVSDTWSGVSSVCPFFTDTVGTSASVRIDC